MCVAWSAETDSLRSGLTSTGGKSSLGMRRNRTCACLYTLISKFHLFLFPSLLSSDRILILICIWPNLLLNYIVNIQGSLKTLPTRRSPIFSTRRFPFSIITLRLLLTTLSPASTIPTQAVARPQLVEHRFVPTSNRVIST